MLKNIRCFIVFIVILVLGSFLLTRDCILEYEVEKILNNLPFNAVKPYFVATSFTEIIFS